jgi:hypothetical protein
MPRRNDGRGGGAKRGRGGRFSTFEQRPKSRPKQKQEEGPGSGDLAGVNVVAPVVVKAHKKNGGLGEGSRALILQMMHELRLQEEADEQQEQEQEQGGGGGGGDKVRKSSMIGICAVYWDLEARDGC